jgi:hypothetical protein
MDVQVSDYIDVEQKALELGYTAPTGLTILPRNFATATSANELIHEGTTPTVRTLLRQAGIQETRLEKEGEKFPCTKHEFWEWVGPIIFVSQAILTSAALPVAINVISSYIYDISKGHRHDAKVTIEFVVETTENTKRGSKRTCKSIKIEGSPKEIKEFDVDTLKQLVEKSGK